MRLDTFPDHAVNTIKSRRACGLFIFEEKDLMRETDREKLVKPPQRWPVPVLQKGKDRKNQVTICLGKKEIKT